MQINAPVLMFSCVLLIASLSQPGCTRSPNELVFEQDQKIYLIDKDSSAVSVFTPDGNYTQSLGTPGAGIPVDATPLSSSIIHYLLLGKGHISGLVWNDLNGNRIPDSGEQGVQDVKVFIDYNSNATYDFGEKFKFTDANGFYIIPNVKTGITNIYIDTSTLPNGYGFTTTHPITVNLSKDQSAIDNDFGIQNQSGIITGRVWDQTDSTPISGVLVYLDMNGNFEYTPGEPHDSTNGSGNFLITHIPGGSYKFNIDDKTIDSKYYQEPGAGTNPTDITLAPGGSIIINFTYVHKVTISGVVRDADGDLWEYVRLLIDLNGNGVYDAGEPVAVTDEFGRYIFNDLPPGTYEVMLLMHSGYNTIVSPGTIITVEGDKRIEANFVTQAQPVSIASFVWKDENGNGTRETMEEGLAGITVFLDTNHNGIKDEGELATVTNTTGAYAFTDLKHGGYFIHADDSSLLKAHIATTQPNPVHKVLFPHETYDGAKFGYQSKLATLNTLQYPSKLKWGGDGKLYVSDNVNGSVFIYDSALDVQGELKGLAKPLGVITDASGNIYVGNQGRENIEVYDPSGNLLRSIGDGAISSPNDLALDRDGNIYILDSTNDQIVIYDQSGNPTGITIGDSNRFDYAVSIAINYRDDGTGNEIGELYVADQLNCTIHVFELNGTYKWSIGSCGSLYTSNWDGKFSGLLAVDVDQYGNIHGLDNNLNVVQVFEPQNRTFVRSYNAYIPGNENLLNLQSDISIHPTDNRVIISNIASKNVEAVTTIAAP